MGVEVIDFDVRPTSIEGLCLVTVKQVADERGTIRELFRRSAFEAAGVTALGTLSQINVTDSGRGAIRGLHAEQTTKLLTLAAGEAFGAYVDTRPASPTYGVVATERLRPGVQVLVPRGVANGFQTLSDVSHYVYCFDEEWRPGMPGVAVNPLDPALSIAWPIDIDPDDTALLSAKDRAAPMFADLGGAP
jgi:dTDP-4-dehydrorhamnose 3,5-epimerase